MRASADDFSNSVIVNAPRDQQRDVADLIRQIDKETDAPQRPVVYKLTYAAATEVAPTIQNLLIANAPKGRGQTSQPAGGGGGGGFFGFIGGLQNQNRQTQAQVSADARTNSLVVTATEDTQKVVAEIIKSLDQEVPVQNSTLVVPLSNARADDVAGLLNQAFGQRQGAGNRGGFNNNNRGNNNNQNRNRNNNNNNRGGGLGGNNLPPNPADGLAINLQDPDADSGEILTQIGVAQFGGFFGGGQNNQNNQNRNQVSRDQSGRIVNSNDLTGQVTTIADPNTNSIIVVSTPENAELIRQIISQLDKIPEQVMIETLIVEASLDNSTKLGVEWKFTQENAFNQRGVTGTAETRFPGPTNQVQEGFRYTLTGGNWDVILNALQSDSKFQVLSTPRIFTSNNVEAQINISQSIPYVLSSREDANGNLTFNYAFEDVGIVLTVTPRITSNGFVAMDVVQTANDLQGFTSFNAPIINQRQAQTTVSVKDGETIVLGGIIRNTVTSTVRKVPLLGDIPILGELFKSTDRTKNKTELLVFLTPRIVRDPDDARNLRERTVNGMSPNGQNEVNKAIPPGPKIPPPGTTPPPGNTGGGTTGGGTTGGGTTGGGTTGGGTTGGGSTAGR